MGVVSPGALRALNDRALVWVFGVAVNGRSAWWAVVIGHEMMRWTQRAYGAESNLFVIGLRRLCRCGHRASQLVWLVG